MPFSLFSSHLLFNENISHWIYFFFQEAYIQYLECVQTIVASLLHDATKLGADITVNSRKFVTLGKQCMERLVLILDSLPQPNNASPRPLSDASQSTYFPGSRMYDGGSQSLPAYTSDFSLSSPQASASLSAQSPSEKLSSTHPGSSVMSPNCPSRPHSISRWCFQFYLGRVMI